MFHTTLTNSAAGRRGRWAHYAAALLLGAGALTIGGCAAAVAVPVTGAVAAGAAEGAASAAVGKSDVMFKHGKFETFQPVAMTDTASSVRMAAADLALTKVGEVKGKDQLKLTYKDQRNQELVVTLVPRTERSTEIRVDVGMFGKEGSGQLFVRQILTDLPAHKTPDKLPVESVTR